MFVCKLGFFYRNCDPPCLDSEDDLSFVRFDRRKTDLRFEELFDYCPDSFFVTVICKDRDAWFPLESSAVQVRSVTPIGNL